MIAGYTRLGTTGGTGAFAVGFGGRNLVPGIVHMAHGRVGKGFGSWGLHAASTAAGVAIGYGIGIAIEAKCQAPDPCRNHFLGIPPGPAYGAMAGSMFGTLLDVVFFAHRVKQSWTASADRPTRAPLWAMSPYAAPKTAGLAAAGAF
jgi:hypothetical protein